MILLFTIYCPNGFTFEDTTELYFSRYFNSPFSVCYGLDKSVNRYTIEFYEINQNQFPQNRFFQAENYYQIKMSTFNYPAYFDMFTSVFSSLSSKQKDIVTTYVCRDTNHLNIYSFNNDHSIDVLTKVERYATILATVKTINNNIELLALRSFFFNS